MFFSICSEENTENSSPGDLKAKTKQSDCRKVVTNYDYLGRL